MKFTLVKLSALALVAASMVSAEESQPKLRDAKKNLPELRGAIQVVSVLVNRHSSVAHALRVAGSETLCFPCIWLLILFCLSTIPIPGRQAGCGPIRRVFFGL